MRKVLVIEDDELTLALMRNILHEEGYAVYTTADGPTGLGLFREIQPELIILDLSLPSMSGLEVLRKIHSVNPDANVVVVTGFGTDESYEIALGYGARHFLCKPLELSSFLGIVRSVAG